MPYLLKANAANNGLPCWCSREVMALPWAVCLPATAKPPELRLRLGVLVVRAQLAQVMRDRRLVSTRLDL